MLGCWALTQQCWQGDDQHGDDGNDRLGMQCMVQHCVLLVCTAAG
jgi:hypothetical protein